MSTCGRFRKVFGVNGLGFLVNRMERFVVGRRAMYANVTLSQSPKVPTSGYRERIRILRQPR